MPQNILQPSINTNRILNLDFIRGISVLGILMMNAISFALPTSSYWNLSSTGTDNLFDWAIGIFVGNL